MSFTPVIFLQATGALIYLFILSWRLTLSTLLICTALLTIVLFYGRYSYFYLVSLHASECHVPPLQISSLLVSNSIQCKWCMFLWVFDYVIITEKLDFSLVHLCFCPIMWKWLKWLNYVEKTPWEFVFMTGYHPVFNTSELARNFQVESRKVTDKIGLSNPKCWFDDRSTT